MGIKSSSRLMNKILQGLMTLLLVTYIDTFVFMNICMLKMLLLYKIHILVTINI